jgi:hypothetical protein
MPHVMTVYSFYHPVRFNESRSMNPSQSSQVKYAYRSIAAFTIHVIDRPIDVLANGPFPTTEEAAGTGDADSDSDTETGAIEHVRKTSSLPQQAKEVVKDVAKDALNTVKKVSNPSSREESGSSWKNRTVFAVHALSLIHFALLIVSLGIPTAASYSRKSRFAWRSSTSGIC